MSNTGREAAEVQVAMPWGLVALKSWNRGCSDVMLLLHGAGSNAASFDSLIPHLSPKYHYLCLDLPGHGFSTTLTPGLPLSFMHFIAVIQRVIHHFAWTKISIMAHSFGAHLGLVLAAAEFERVERLILLDGTARNPLPDELYLTRCNGELKELLQAEAKDKARPQTCTYDQAMQRATSTIFPLSREAAHSILKRSLIKAENAYFSNADFRSCFKMMPHMSRKVHLYNCRLIKCPVLMLFPDSSKLQEIHRSDFHQAIIRTLLASHPLSRVEHVPGDHNVHCDNPTVIATVVNRFLEDTKSATMGFQGKL